MKQIKPATTTTEKLGLKTQTLRKLNEGLTDEQLAQVNGGRAGTSERSYPTGGC